MKVLSSLFIFVLAHLPLVSMAANHTGTYTCENETAIGTINLENDGRSHFMSVEIKRKGSEVSNEYSGSAFRTSLGDKGITSYTVGRQSLWFFADGSAQYNRTIDCTKN